MPENGHHAIGTDARADQAILVVLEQGFRGFADGVQQHVSMPCVRFEQGFDGRAQLHVVAAGTRQVQGTFVLTRVDQLLEERLNLLPARARNHTGPLPLISFSSHARASRMSRWTVAADVPSDAAIWSYVRPPK